MPYGGVGQGEVPREDHQANQVGLMKARKNQNEVLEGVDPCGLDDSPLMNVQLDRLNLL